MKRIMKGWWLLGILALILLMWSLRERFETYADALKDVGQTAGYTSLTPKCPEGSALNSENTMCKFTDTTKPDAVPKCSSDTLEFVGSACVPKPGTGTSTGGSTTTMGVNASGGRPTETPGICSNGSKPEGNFCFDPNDAGIPPNVCRSPAAKLEDGVCVEKTDVAIVSSSPNCPPGTGFQNGRKCIKYTLVECPPGSTKQTEPSGRIKCMIGSTTGGTTTAGGNRSSTTGGTGVTPSTVQKSKILGPVFTSYGAPIDGVPDSHKSNRYPELLGGGAPVSRKEERTLPTDASLGTLEMSKFFPFSRQPGDMDLIPDPYRVSQQFSSASYSFKTEPTPFLTDFSAFFR